MSVAQILISWWSHTIWKELFW